MNKVSIKLIVVLCLLGLLVGNANAKPTLEDFLQEKDLMSAEISPDGHYLAQLWNKGDARVLTIADLHAPGTPIVGQTSDRVVRARSLSWANNERLLVNVLVPYDMVSALRSSENKKDFDIDEYFMFSRILSMDVHAKNAVVLLEDQRSFRGNMNWSAINNYLPEDNNHILMSAYRDDKMTLFKVDIYSGKSEVVAKGGRFTFMFVSDANGKPLYRLDYKRIAKEIDLYEIQGHDEWRPVDSLKVDEVEGDESVSLGDLVAINGQNLIYRKKNETTGFLELLSYNNKDKKVEQYISFPDRDILFPFTDRQTNQILGYALDGDLIRYKFFDSASQKNYDAIAEKVGDYDFHIGSATTDGEKSIVKIYGADNPLSFSIYDAKTSELKLIQNAYFNISSKNLSYPAMATFTARDGKKIPSYILLPSDYKKGSKYPLLVMPHGGPQSRDRASYDDFAQFLSTRGYIVIKPNFRGSVGYGKVFEELGYKQWGMAMQDDLADAVNFMVKKGYADPNKVCIVGISYGGYAALMGVIKTPDLYRCSVSINAVTHLRDIIAYDANEIKNEARIQKYLYQRVGDPIVDQLMLDENSPALHADKIKVPLLIIGSTEDDIVPFSQVKAMVSALKKNKKEHKFIVLKDSGHNPFVYKEDVETVYREVNDFLAKYLQ